MDETRTQVEMFGAAAAAEVVEPRSVGRPKGAMNRRSRDWQRFVAASGKVHPLEFLLDVVGSTPAELRERYGSLVAPREEGEAAELSTLGAKDLLALQVRAAEAALPYLEQKLPQAIEVDVDKPRPVIVIGDLSQTAQRRIDGKLGLRVIEQNQTLSGRILDRSDS